MDKNIIIIGAGQLGSRHLQGLKKMTTPASVYVVDPNNKSLEVAETRANEIDSDIKVYFYQRIEAISQKHFNIAIIATNADIRAAVTENLLENKKVDFILFEKILFQKEDDYTKINELLIIKNVKAWVNCPRRIQPLYKKIKNDFNNIQDVKMKVSGGDWSLACNGIHFLDLFYFFYNNEILEIDTSALDSAILESKRPGYREITGRIEGKSGVNGFSIASLKGSNEPIEVYLIINGTEIIISESAGGAMEIRNFSGTEKHTAKLLFQSELTGSLADEILINGSCGLTTYTESMWIHLEYIRKIKMHIENSTRQKLNHCPIT